MSITTHVQLASKKIRVYLFSARNSKQNFYLSNSISIQIHINVGFQTIFHFWSFDSRIERLKGDNPENFRKKSCGKASSIINMWKCSFGSMFDKNFIKIKACATVDMVTRFFDLKKVFSKLTQSLLYSHIYTYF